MSEANPFEGRDCPDCGAKKGQFHLLGCDVERCPRCGGQMISCDCHRDDGSKESGEEFLARIDPTRIPWNEEWPL